MTGNAGHADMLAGASRMFGSGRHGLPIVIQADIAKKTRLPAPEREPILGGSCVWKTSGTSGTWWASKGQLLQVVKICFLGGFPLTADGAAQV
jgi:hypothetical protein